MKKTIGKNSGRNRGHARDPNDLSRTTGKSQTVARVKETATQYNGEKTVGSSEQRLRSLMDASPVGISWMNVETGKIEYINDRFTQMFGYRLEDMPTIDRWFEIATTGQEARDNFLSRQNFNAGQEINEPVEITVTCKNGARRIVEIMACLAGGYLVATFNDVTDFKKAYEELRLRAEILDNAYDSIVIFDENRNYVYVNETALKYHGYSREEFDKLGSDRLIVPGYDGNRPQITKTLNKKGEVLFETAHFTKEGSIIHLEVHAKKLRVGNRDYVLSISRNINERKEAEKDLRLRAELLDNAYDSIFVTDTNGNLLYANKTTINIFGYSEEELLGMNVDNLSNENPRRNKQIKEIANKSGVYAFEITYRRKDNSTFPAEVFARIVEIGDKMYSASVSRDISERKQVEKELRFRAELLDSTNDSIFVWNRDDGSFVYANELTCTSHGYTRDEFTHLKIEDIIAPESPIKAKTGRHGVISAEGEDIFESIHKRRDGSVFPCEIHAREIQIEGKPCILSIGRDISRRKEYEKDLQLRAELLDNSSDSVFVLDLEDNFVYFNETTCQMYGYTKEELRRIKIRDLTSFDSYDSLESRKKITLEQGGDFFEASHRRKDGSTFACEIRGKLFEMDGKKYILSISRDITQRKQAEEERKDNEKRLIASMEATILALSKTVEMRDPYTSGHQLRSTLLANAIASELGFTEEQNRGLYLAGIVHDIGKIMIPAEILSKPGKLSEFEFDLIKMHPRAGYDMLKDIKFPWPIAQIVAQHHERINGSGYPMKLHDKEILTEAKILAVADVVEAIASHRPYRPAMGIDVALEEIEKNRGILYDRAAVDACLNLFRNKNFHFE